MDVTINDVTATAETDKAVLCVIDGDEYWIPKSQITDDSEVWEKGQQGELVVTEWFAEKEGLS